MTMIAEINRVMRKEKRMKAKWSLVAGLLLLFLPSLGIQPSGAAVNIQCPCPAGTPVSPDTGNIECTVGGQSVACKSLAAGDGFTNMADATVIDPQTGQGSRLIYIFSFSDVTGLPEDQVMDAGMLGAQFSAPTINVKEGQDYYLNLTNVGMQMRPDLFDPHTVHFHGYPNAASVFDGEPMASIAINMGSTLTYYYKGPGPGTYLYHCHVEATEHMQMGMLGNLYVRPRQDGTPITYQGKTYTKFAYNDGDGSTGYDKDFPIQLVAVDPDFHDADLYIQPLPFAAMTDTYPMLNGRGYPDTINPEILNNNASAAFPGLSNADKASRKVNSVITATQGERVLLRLSSLSTVDFYTVGILGIPMKVVGKDAKILRSSTGQNLYYDTNSITLGGGEAADIILDTANIPPGTYPLYVTNLERLSNNQEDFGGMMTEIVIN